MPVNERHIRRLYQRFVPSRMIAQLKSFSNGVDYYQENTDRNLVGLVPYAEEIAGWSAAFSDMDVTVQNIEESQPDFRSDAVQVFTVSFYITGNYIRSLPGFEEIAPADGRRVQLLVVELLQVDAEGRIIYVHNELDQAALVA